MEETKLLKKILSRKGLSNTYRTYKRRFIRGTISGKTIEFILKKEGYVKERDAVWMPIKKK